MLYSITIISKKAIDDLVLMQLRVSWPLTHLRHTEQSAENPCNRQQNANSTRCPILADWIQYRQTPVETDDNDHIRRQIKAEYLPSAKQRTVVSQGLKLAKTDAGMQGNAYLAGIFLKIFTERTITYQFGSFICNYGEA